jgi:DNA uptake protein ComE-like DNA-binding protein
MNALKATPALLLLFLAGCSCNNTDAIRERTADVTAAAKRDSKAIASGVIEGLQRKGPWDINSASAKDLESLPKITPALAHAIIDGRPYKKTSDLYHRHILTKDQYNRISSQILVRKDD